MRFERLFAALSPRALRGLALMAIAIVGMAAASVYYLRPWVVVHKPQLAATYTVVHPSPENYTEVQYEFVSAALVWALELTHSDYGNHAGTYRLFRSVDGARTWTTERQGKTGAVWATESSFRFVDPATGFLATDDPLVLRKTSDRGRTWKAVTLPTHQDLLTIRFIDARHGWATAGTQDSWRMFATDDGGVTWTPPIDVPSSLMLEPQFRASGEGWAGSFGDHPYLFASNDGGRTWARHDLPKPDLPADVSFTSSVQFVPGGGLLVLVEATTPESVVGDYCFRSLDGGVSWIRLASPTSDPSSPTWSVFQDSIHWWVVADSSLYKTSDGGDSWIRSEAALPLNLSVSRILDPRHAWGRFYDDSETFDLGFTSDGGLHWTRLKAPNRK